MLQFRVESNESRDMAVLAREAMDGGCLWLQLHAPEKSDKELKSVAEELIPECRQRGVILTLENKPDLARELGVHGVCLLGRDFSAGAVREKLGAEAIIGVEVSTVAAASTMQSLDIDYVVLPADFTSSQRLAFTAEAAAAGLTIPIVASGDFTAADAGILKAERVSGVLTGHAIAGEEAPARAVAEMIEALK